MSPILSVSAVTKTYKSGQVALHEIDLAVEKGEIFALLGPNGAGKTTLISIICGLVSMTSGRILVDGYNIISEYRAARAMIGLVPQEIALDIFATVEDTVGYSRARLFGRRAAPAISSNCSATFRCGKDAACARYRAVGRHEAPRDDSQSLEPCEPDILFLDEPNRRCSMSADACGDMWELVRPIAGPRRHDHPHHTLHRGG